MYTQTEIEIIKEIILKFIPGVHDIMLFGSYAGGTVQQDSDLDFAVLTRDLSDV
jgi:predicted nucleotidyltransferase